MYSMRIIDAAQFRRLVTMDDVIPGVELAYRLFSSGKAGLFPVITHEFDPGRTDGTATTQSGSGSRRLRGS